MIDLQALTPTHTGEPPAFSGTWHAIEFQPELEVPQRFVVGAALAESGRLIGWRMAQEAPRLKCFYRGRYSKATWSWLLERAELDFVAARGRPVQRFESRSPQVRLGEGMFTSGADWQSALNRAFDRIVTVLGDERAPPFQGLPQTELRAQVNELLKKITSTRFETFAQPAGGLQVNDKGEHHVFDITHDDGRVATTVVSACYASLDTAQANVYRATADLMRYRYVRPRNRLGLAVLQPLGFEKLPAETREAWRGWWGEESFKFKQADDILVAEPLTVQDLAQAVADWYA